METISVTWGHVFLRVLPDVAGERTPTFLQNGLAHGEGELLQRLHVLVSGAEDADLGQTHHQGSGHRRLIVVPASHRAGDVAEDDGAGGGKAVVGQEHAAGLQLQLGTRNKTHDSAQALHHIFPQWENNTNDIEI